MISVRRAKFTGVKVVVVGVQIVLDHCVERTSRDDNEPSLTVHNTHYTTLHPVDIFPFFSDFRNAFLSFRNGHVRES